MSMCIVTNVKAFNEGRKYFLSVIKTTRKLLCKCCTTPTKLLMDKLVRPFSADIYSKGFFSLFNLCTSDIYFIAMARRQASVSGSDGIVLVVQKRVHNLSFLWWGAVRRAHAIHNSLPLTICHLLLADEMNTYQNRLYDIDFIVFNVVAWKYPERKSADSLSRMFKCGTQATAYTTVESVRSFEPQQILDIHGKDKNTHTFIYSWSFSLCLSRKIECNNKQAA